MIARIVSDQRRQAVTQRAKPPAAVRRPAARRRQRIGVKNSEGRIRNRIFKIKGLLALPKNVDLKKSGVVVQKMVLRRRTIFPAEIRRTYY